MLHAQVHMTLCGPVVLDIVQHFVERWNEVKKRKYAKDTYVQNTRESDAYVLK